MIAKLKFCKKENGQAAVLLALVFIVLLGFVALTMDIGRATVEKSDLQNAADASALAGAQSLPDSSAAISAATSYAQKNGVENSKIQVVTPYKGDSKKVEVVCTRTVEYTFARVLGYQSTTVTVKAVASRSGVEGGISGLRPWAITDKYSYTYGEEFVLKVGGGGGSQGYYGIVSFGSQGGDANTYKGNILDGYDGIVKIGDIVKDASGNKNVKKDINELMDRSGDTLGDYTKATDGDSRVVIIPKIDANNVVIGFSAIYLESVDNKGYITANFLYDTTWTEEQQGTHNDWGLNSDVKLTE
ncbi:MAG: hypothetical protein GX424_09845 [Clostridiales bacterium]|nr:hypothetical protein [Clostridiales bacterium]